MTLARALNQDENVEVQSYKKGNQKFNFLKRAHWLPAETLKQLGGYVDLQTPVSNWDLRGKNHKNSKLWLENRDVGPIGRAKMKRGKHARLDSMVKY